MDCPSGMSYEAVTSACHVTCENPLAETECALPDTEACKCAEGKVYHQRTCQDPQVCGCLDDNGIRHAVSICSEKCP